MAKSVGALRIQDWWKPARDAAAEPIFPTLSLPAIQGLLPTGLGRGAIVEICGPRSSGRTGLAHHMLAQATLQGEVCAVVDLHGAFAPAAARGAGVVLPHIVWVRCNSNIQHALRAADMLIHAGGFGVVLLDLCNASAAMLNRIPLSYWFRFRRAIEHTPANLIICGDTPVVKSCASVSFALESQRFEWSGEFPGRILRGIDGTVIARTGGNRPLGTTVRRVA